MLLSVKQYAILFVLFFVILVSVFSYQINSNIENTRHKIDASQRAAAKTELEHSIILTLENIKQSANKLSHWQEVRQQIENPEIFAYWYSVRFKEYAFDLQEHTLDLMIYDINGKALARLDDSTLPYEIQAENSDSISFQIASSNNILYISPVYIDEKKQSIIGYLGARIQFLPLLKSLSNFQFIELGTLRLHTDKIGHLFNTFSTAQFSYDLHKSEGMIELETQIQESITELAFIIIISTILLYVALVFIIGIPMQDITSYINKLRTKPETIDKHNYHGLFQVSELKTIYDSLTQYHTELRQNEEHLSLTLNSIGDAVITTDSENNILRMNPVAESLTGWSFDEAKGFPLKQIFNIVDSSNKKSMNIDFDKVIESGETAHLGKHNILISKDKTEYFIADS
ncbi:MAG: PAS domain S-box protein, partial [Gammaproteobacteria bacterium]|nr:PAS domain S-box protein [Gammaproteobacteria bacterium]